MDFTPLISAARAVQGEFALSHEGTSAGRVAAALLCQNGKIYTGICMDLHCGIGFCAEHAAAVEMLKDRQTRVIAMVAVSEKGILPPCGRCREMLRQLDHHNNETQVLIDEKTSVSLDDLLPHDWYGK